MKKTQERCPTCKERTVYCRCNTTDNSSSERKLITSELDGRIFAAELIDTFKAQGPGAATKKLNTLRKSELVIVSNVLMRTYLSTPVHIQKG